MPVPPPTRMTRLSPGRRRTFRILGWLTFVPGILLFSAPFLAVPLAMMNLSGPSLGFLPLAFLLAFPGFILVAVGGTLLRFGYMKPLAEIGATETADAAEHTSTAMARGLGRGLQESGWSMGGRDIVKVKCRSCGFLESEDARFCSQCAKPV